MKIGTYFKWLFCFAVAILILSATIAKAQTTPTKSGIQISPLTYNFEIKPGESQNAKITLKNLNKEPLNYITEVESFSQTSDEGAPSFAGQGQVGCTPSIADWFFFGAEEKGTILTGQEKEIPFTITVPKDAEPGGHYAAVFGREVKDLATGKTEVGITSRVGTLLLISVPGEVTNGAEITEFKTPKYVFSGPIDFSMKVKNTGTVHYDSVGSVSIKPLLGGVSKFELATHTILPKNSRIFEKNWTKKYPFGYYKVTPTATDGAKKEVTMPPVTIIAIPLVIVIPILAGLVILVFLLLYIRKHLRFVNDQQKQGNPN